MRILALALLMALFSNAPLMAATSADSIMIKDPYVRAVPPGQPNSAAFMTIHNQGGGDYAIVHAKSDSAKVLELHTHTKVNGMMRMRQIPQIDIPTSGIQLKPGGLHIMLIGLKQQLKPGQNVGLELIFADGSKKHIIAPVRKIMTGMKTGMGMGMHK
jgi:periplasmic copper chaperone A